MPDRLERTESAEEAVDVRLELGTEGDPGGSGNEVLSQGVGVRAEHVSRERQPRRHGRRANQLLLIVHTRGPEQLRFGQIPDEQLPLLRITALGKDQECVVQRPHGPILGQIHGLRERQIPQAEVAAQRAGRDLGVECAERRDGVAR